MTSKKCCGKRKEKVLKKKKLIEAPCESNTKTVFDKHVFSETAATSAGQ